MYIDYIRLRIAFSLQLSVMTVHLFHMCTVIMTSDMTGVRRPADTSKEWSCRAPLGEFSIHLRSHVTVMILPVDFSICITTSLPAWPSSALCTWQSFTSQIWIESMMAHTKFQDNRRTDTYPLSLNCTLAARALSVPPTPSLGALYPGARVGSA